MPLFTIISKSYGFLSLSFSCFLISTKSLCFSYIFLFSIILFYSGLCMPKLELRIELFDEGLEIFKRFLL